jgi:hypothetical protein
VVVDRSRRRPLLVGTDLGRAALLCAIPALHALDLLSLPALMLLVTAIGVLSLFFDAANQAFLPRLVPAALLTSRQRPTRAVGRRRPDCRSAPGRRAHPSGGGASGDPGGRGVIPGVRAAGLDPGD